MVVPRVAYSRVLLRGSRGPSTVTFMHLLYVIICGGDVEIWIVRLKLFPEIKPAALIHESTRDSQQMNQLSYN